MVLLVFCIITTQLVCSVYANFYVTDEAEATAKIAIFAVNVTGDSGNIDLNADGEPGNRTATASQSYVIVNKEDDQLTEVPMTYAVVVTLDKALPTGTTMTLTDGAQGNATVTPTVTNEGKTYTYTHSSWEFGATAEQTNTVTLTFDTDNNNGDAVSDTVSVQVDVTATQKTN